VTPAVPAGKTAREPGHIYTRFGDAGQTRLLGEPWSARTTPGWRYTNSRRGEFCPGAGAATTRYDDVVDLVLNLQGELMQVMSLLATPPGLDPPVPPLAVAQIKRMEGHIDCFEPRFLLRASSSGRAVRKHRRRCTWRVPLCAGRSERWSASAGSRAWTRCCCSI